MSRGKYEYYDITAGNMLISSLMARPELFDTPEMEKISAKDFVDKRARVMYSVLFNLHRVGHTKVSLPIIETQLVGQPAAQEFFKNNGGPEFVEKMLAVGDISNFNPSVEKVKKMTLLRNLNTYGLNVSQYYDWETKNEKIISEQDNWLQLNSLEDITQEIQSDFDSIILDSGMKSSVEEGKLGDGMEDLILSFKKSPEFGTPMSISMSDTLVRGARKGKFYLRSAPTGGGKSRLMMADTCHFGANKIYSHHEGRWVDNDIQEPSLFISTELDKEELQTMAIAYLSGIDEDKILNGALNPQEEQIALEAAKVYKESPIYIVFIPDFSIGTIERLIKKYYREHQVEYVNFDYIHTSISFISEISQATNGMALREDQLLFMLSTRLKELANNLYIFIQSATQLNGDWEEKEEVNQNLLRGAKAIADRVDVGAIAMKVRDIDIPIVDKIEQETGQRPNYFISYYKIRRGKYAGSRLWCNADLGTCRARGIMVTNQYGQPTEFDSYLIHVKKQEQKDNALFGRRSAFE